LTTRSPDLHVSLRDVEVAYRGKQVVQPTTLSLPLGITAFMGNNGEGKSSLIRVLAGVQPPSRGFLLRGGQDAHASGAARRQHHRVTGWLPQEAGLPRNVTVRELVDYAAWHKQVARRERRTASSVAIEQVDLVEQNDSRVGALSGGQRRRVALAAAIVGAPDLLLLDEPTTGLDPTQRDQLHGVLRSLPASRVVVATHLVEDVLAVADHVLFIRGGVVQAPIPMSELVPAGTDLETASRALRLGLAG